MKNLFPFLLAIFLVACGNETNSSQNVSPSKSLEQDAAKMKNMRGDPHTSKIPSLLDENESVNSKKNR